MRLRCWPRLLAHSRRQFLFDGISIPFDQEIYIVQEELENSADELLLTLLYASDPGIGADEEAEICEIESADIENSFRTYLENISAGGSLDRKSVV